MPDTVSEVEKALRGKPFIGGDVPNHEDLKRFNALLGADNVNVQRWVRHMATFTPDERSSWPQAQAKGEQPKAAAAPPKAAAAAPKGEEKKGGKAEKGGEKKGDKKDGKKEAKKGAKFGAEEALHVRRADGAKVGDVEVDIEAALGKLVGRAIVAAFPELGEKPPAMLIERGKTHEYQCNNAMAIPKRLAALPKKVSLSPGEVAGRIIEKLDFTSGLLEEASAVSRGYINITVSRDYLNAAVTKMLQSGPQPPKVATEKVLIDFSSPNIAKKMHVGHLRSTIIGDALARTFEFVGHDVERINHVGDWGTQFGMLIAHLKSKCPDFLTSPPDITDLVGFYKEAKKRFDSEPDFKLTSKAEVVKLQSHDETNIKGWKMLCDISRKEFSVVYKRLGVKLEERGESFYNPIIPDCLQKLKDLGQCEKSDGADVVMSCVAKEVKGMDKQDGERVASWYFFLEAGGKRELVQPMLDVCKEGKVARESDGVIEIKAGKTWVPLDQASRQEQLPQFWKECAGLLKPLHPKLVKALDERGRVKEGKVLVPRFDYPLIVRKADGGFGYASTDMAAAWHRLHKSGKDRVIYVTDKGQQGHFFMIFQMAEDAGWRKGGAAGAKRMDHVAFGVVKGPDGQKYKTRSGEVALLEDLLEEGVTKSVEVTRQKDEDRVKKDPGYVKFSEEQLRANAEAIGIGAIKYCDLRQNRESDYVFDQEKMLSFEGNTAVGVQYAYARVCSLGRKAGVDPASLRGQSHKLQLLLGCEKRLAMELLRFPAVITKTLDDLLPHNITDYLDGLVTRFSDCFNDKEWKVVGSDMQTSRLLLSDITAQVIKKALGLLGIEVLEKI
eukprot:Hpha_TRINITY_DN16287_c2_g6::TRINITY_DN16287_c2_g6_i1::g.11694::m.11694/K01887/RARS, argS; arginyl-tRNA synthetase